MPRSRLAEVGRAITRAASLGLFTASLTAAVGVFVFITGRAGVQVALVTPTAPAAPPPGAPTAVAGVVTRPPATPLAPPVTRVATFTPSAPPSPDLSPSATPSPIESAAGTATPSPFPSAPTRAASATPVGGGTGFIAFASDRDGNSELYRMTL
ncbi:MAG: hypothetical protein KA764_22400, partial [Anaerolineales bacterium]|nr:hypothetical protein [Anaerolineales bacterium]